MGVLVIYNIRFTLEGIKLVGDALDLLPHGKVAAMVNNIQSQIIEQERALREAANLTATAPPVEPKPSRSRKPKIRS